MKRKSLPRIIRIFVATAVFCAFILLFLDLSGLFHKWLAPVAKLQFWPALLAANVGAAVLTIAVTAVFGRWYCSCLCPLGILQDGVNALSEIGSKKRKFRFGYKKSLRWIKYPVLVAFLALVCLGLGTVACLIEPYSIFGRAMSCVKGAPLASAVIAGITIAVIAALTVKGGRIWCTSVCPVGTILGIISRRSLFRPVFDESKCVSCGLCGKACKSSCIDTKNHTVDTSRCVMCMDCLDNCSQGAIKYGFSPVRNERTAAKEADGKTGSGKHDEERRRFLTTAAAVTAAATASRVEVKAKTVLAALEKKTVPQRATPVVPPGAKSLKHFTDHCVSCHLCVATCPNHVLKPSTGMEYFMIPLMSFEDGFCRPECNTCSTVCPAGAIVGISPEEKTAISIGHAVYNPENCIILTDNVNCGNCARHCPAGAISMIMTENGRLPAVNPERCIGCGRCEYVCPSRPVSAIYVEGNSVHRDI